MAISRVFVGALLTVLCLIGFVALRDIAEGGPTSGSIGDLVWLDTNGDGVKGTSESGLGGVRVTLTGAGSDGTLGTGDDISFTPKTTSSNGSYSFTKLAAGLYRVGIDEALTPSYAVSSGNDPLQVNLAAGQVFSTADFGMARPEWITLAFNPAALSTFAGNNWDATIDGFGTSASFRAMGGGVTSNGYLYVGTLGSIRKVNLSNGQVTTLAGNSGLFACNVDSTVPSNVRFQSIDGLATDGSNIYSVSRYCNSVRKTSIATGATSLVASLNAPTSISHAKGFLYVPAEGSQIVRIDPANGAKTTFATFSGIEALGSIASDFTYLWASNQVTGGNREIRRIALSGAAQTVISTSDGSGIGLPALASAGNYLYNVDGTGNRLRRYSKADGTFLSVAGTGIAGLADGADTDAWISDVRGITSDGTNLWIADNGNRRVRKAVSAAPLPSSLQPSATTTLAINPAAVTTLAGNGVDATVDGIGTAASFTDMAGTVVVGGHAYVATTGSIRKINLGTGDVSRFTGYAPQIWCTMSSSAVNVRLAYPSALSTDGHYLYLAQTCAPNNAVIARISLATGAASQVGGSFTSLTGLTYGGDGYLYATSQSYYDGWVYRIDRSTGSHTIFSTYRSNDSNYYASVGPITSDASDLYVVASEGGGGKRIDRLSLATATRTVFSPTSGEIGTGALASAGSYLYGSVATPYGDTALRRYDKSNASWVNVAGTTGAGYADGTGTDAWFGWIKGVASDGANLWIADSGNRRFRKAVSASSLPSSQSASATTTIAINPAVITTFAGNGADATFDATGTAASFKDMSGVVVVSGHAYVATTGAIRKISLTTGQVTTLAGHPTAVGCTSSPDPSLVRLAYPVHLTTDGYYLYLAQACAPNNSLISRISIATGATSQVGDAFSNLMGITFGGDGYLYVTSQAWYDGWVYRVDPRSGVRTTFSTYRSNDSNYYVSMGAITSDSNHLFLPVSEGGGGYQQRIDRIALSDATRITIVPATGDITPGALTSAGEYLYGSFDVSHSDTALRRYRKSDGTWVNIAGNKASGYADGIGTDAWFGSIKGLATDGTNLWIADNGNRRIRKAVAGSALPSSQNPSATTTLAINPAAITTLAGNGANATFDGTGSGASFTDMAGTVVVGGNAYVATTGAIRKVSLTNGQVTTVAGHPTAVGCTSSPDPSLVRLAYPVHLTTDGYYLYLAQGCAPNYSLVSRISIATGAASPVTEISSSLSGITFGGDGYIYVGVRETFGCATGYVYRVHPIQGTRTLIRSISADPGGYCLGMGAMTSDASYLYMLLRTNSSGVRIERTALADATTTTLVGPGTFGEGGLVSAGNYLYASAFDDTMLRRITKADGTWVNIAGTPNSGYADAAGTDAWFGSIKGLATDGANLWIADNGNRRIRKAVPSSALPSASPPSATTTVAINPAAVTTFAGNGSDITADGTGSSASFRQMGGVVVVGNFAYVGNVGAIRKVNLATGEVTTLAGHPTEGGCTNSADPSSVRFWGFQSMATDGYYLYTTGCFGEVRRTSISTGATSRVAALPSSANLLTFTAGRLYVTDSDRTIYKVDPISGTVSQFAQTEVGPITGLTSDSQYLWAMPSTGGGWFGNPASRLKRISLSDVTMVQITETGDWGSELASAGNYLYSSHDGHVLRRFSKSDGSWVDIAGSTTPGYVDDMGTSARFNSIRGIVSDGTFLWVVDDGNKRLRLAGSLATLMSGAANFGWDGYGAWGEDVNAALGNFVNSATDIEIDTSGPDLELTRTYNSLDDKIGALGKGWSFNYEMFWSAGPGDAITILYPDGRREIHTKNPDGTYSPPAGYFSKLVPDGLGGYRLTAKDATVYTFNSSGQITSIADQNGRVLSLTYVSGKLSRARDVISDRSLFFTWTDNRITQVSSDSVSAHGGALTWKYYYSGDKLIKACDPRNNSDSGSCLVYTYTNQRLSLIAKPRGNTEVEVAYQADGKVDWRKDGLLNLTNFTYVSNGVVDVTDPRNHTTRQEYDGKYRLTKETDPASGVTSYEYDIKGNRTKVTDPNNNFSTMAYDTRGNLTSETDPEGKTRYMSYDSSDNMLASRDRRSTGSSDNTYATTFTYDTNGNKLTETSPVTPDFPSGVTKRWTYTSGSEAAIGGGLMPAGLLRTEKDGRENTTTYSYDAKGDLRKIVDAVGLEKNFTYDEIGRKLSEATVSDTYPAGVTTSYTYDVMGEVLTETGPQTTDQIAGASHRAKKTNVYDGNSNVSQTVVADIVGTDPSRVTAFTYDANDRELSTTDPESGVLSRTYDAAGNVLTTTDQEGRVIEAEYNSRNLQTKLTLKNFVDDPVGGSTPRDLVLRTFTYDAAGRKATETDQLGRVTEFTYDKADRTTQVKLKNFDNRDASLRDIVLVANVYDAEGQLLSETSGGGKRRVEHVYDAAGKRTSSTLDPASLNQVTTYAYDPSGNQIRQSTTADGRTEEVRAAYDAADRKTSETVENGTTDLVTSFTYDRLGNVASKTDPRGNLSGATPADFTTNFTYDELNRQTKAMLPSVQVEENGGGASAARPVSEASYNTFGEQVRTKDSRGKVTLSAYDKLGRRTSITHPSYVNPDGVTVTASESFSYDRVGNLTARTDRRGKTTDYVFDKLNRAVRATDPLISGEQSRGFVKLTYDDVGNKLSQTDQRGAKTTYSYDDLNRMRTETRVVRKPPAPDDLFTTTFDYDDLGNQTYKQNPEGGTVTATFSAASEKTTETDELGKTSSFTYDLASRPVRQTDELGRYSENSYDLAGRQTFEKRYSSSATLLTTTSFGHDAAGNQTSVTTPRTFTTTFAYDATNRLKQVVEPVTSTSSITTTYGYDAQGNLTRSTDGEGRATILTHQAWNLLEKIIEPSTTAHPALADRTFTSVYDAGGLAIQERQPGSVTIARSFDELGRLTSESGSGGGAAAASRTFGYDKASLRTSAGHPTSPVNFTYDDRRLMTSSTGGPGSVTFTYDSVGRMGSRTDAAGSHNFGWTPRSELASATDPLTSTTYTYTHDDAGQTTEVKYGSGATPAKRTLVYDQLGRLTSDTLTNTSATQTARHQYGYDSDGNLTSQVIDLPGNTMAGTHGYTYDQAGRIASWTPPGGVPIQYTWDKAGNRIQAGLDTYTYDERNRLTSAPGTPRKNYTYTPRGTLTQISDGVNPATTFTYDSLGRTTGYSDPAGTVAYTFDSLDRIATRGASPFTYSGTELDPSSDGTSTYARSPSGRLLSLTKGASTSIAGQNRHGDLTYLFGTTGSLTDTQVFDPFGKVIAETGTTNPDIGFQSDYTDPASGNVWMGARWYDGDTANFLSRDSVSGQLKTPITLNRYTYAQGDPLSFFDPDGHFSFRLGSLTKRFGSFFSSRSRAHLSGRKMASSFTASSLAVRAIGVQDERSQHRTNAAYWRQKKALVAAKMGPEFTKALKDSKRSGGNLIVREVLSKEGAIDSQRGFTNFSAGFVDQATKSLTFGKWSSNIGPIYKGEIYQASYRVGKVAAQAEEAIATVATGATVIKGAAKAVQFVKAAGSLRAAGGLAKAGAVAKLSALKSSVGSTTRAIGSHARLVLANDRGAVSLGRNVDAASDQATNLARFEDLAQDARSLYPKKAGGIEQHHIVPKYLGGDSGGPTVSLDASYHQLITNEFRSLRQYGRSQPVPSPDELSRILNKVYSKYPIPGMNF